MQAAAVNRPAQTAEPRVAPEEEALPPHARESSEVAAELQTSPLLGLSADEAAARLQAYGPNRLEQARRPAYARIALRQFRDPLVVLLAAAAGVSLVVGEGLEASVVAIIVVLNAILGFIQEAGAERAVLALGQSVARTATVVREGNESEIPAAEVVPGDLLIVHDGDRVAADARLVEVSGLEVDESMLTGESVPVAKHVEPVPVDAPPAERESMIFGGTGATRGRAAALVTATGAGSEVGRLTGLMQSIRRLPTPLQLRLGALARVMAIAGGILTIVLGGMLWAQGAPAQEAFLVGVAVAVAAVPEGLAATVTIALALGARAMATRGAIVRRISAVETAGQATVICADKTGTLTENRLRVVATSPAPGWTARDVVEAAVFASSGGISDPVEAAIAEAAVARGLEGRRSDRAVHEIPFDALRKRMTVVMSTSTGTVAFVKGAPELVIERSLADSTRARLQATAQAWAEEGLRVLAVARRDLPPDAGLDEDEVERELVLVGLLALHDPLRATAAEAVEEARAAGVRLKMLTGDHPVTAHAIASSLGIEEQDVFARITPADKLRIVEELQEGGDVVAVTGDGVNDAPALRRADVGIAMGRSGAEAAREAADIVLTNDELGTIVAAIREGRRIYDNITKFVAFLLSANLGEVVLFATAILAGLGAPMTIVQVLVINLITDGLPAVALARDPAVPGHERLLQARSRALLSPRVWGALAAVGLLVGAAAFAAFMVGRALGGDVAQTMAFVTVGVAELGFVFSCRSVLRPAWRVPVNPFLVGGVAASLLVLVLAVYAPVHGAFETVPPGPVELITALGLALVPVTVIELAKAVGRRFGRAS
jgi:Ca2+-transporting ATPase